MYRVFIVDDEEFVIKSLIGSIQWETLGFEVVAKATNGREALDLIMGLEVDVVFSDVRMPGISGLELMKEVQKINPNIIFIIISGYPEFVYVQKALNNGALGYCLKPFDETEISKLLVKASNIIDSRSRITYDDFFILAELIHDPNKKDILKEKLKSKGLSCDDKNDLSVISFTGMDYPELNFFKTYITFRTGVQKAYTIVPTKFITQQSFTSFFEGQNYVNVKGIGISEPIFSLEGLQNAIEEANLLSFQYFMDGNKICSYRIKDNFRKGEEVVNHILNGYMRETVSLENVQSKLDELLDRNLINIKHAIKIYNCLAYFNDSCETLNQNSIYGFDDLARLFVNFKSMSKYLNELLINEKTIGIKERRNINFNQILNFVNSNFCADLTIQEISEKYYINPSYLSQLFRKEVGVTFTDYVTKLKMEFAKELLQDETKKMIDISQKCGYNDYFYFLRIFKKYYGISPGQYRNAQSI